MNGAQVLYLPMQENDAGANTIREYLLALLTKVWEEGEGFSGKRPFGNSGWDYELYKALIQNKAIKGTLDEYGDIERFDERAGSKMIFSAIEALG